jgi:glucosamine-6-phosphate deaminase
MEVIVQKNKQAASKLVAALIAHQVAEHPRTVLGLATGRTMESVYDYLVQFNENDRLNFSEVSTFNLDEYIGLAGDDANSYRHYMNEKLFSRINIHHNNTHLPNGIAADIDQECEHYEQLILDVGGIDLQLLGIGRSGHIGFNEPLSALRSRTRAKGLTPQTLEQNAELFEGGLEQVPKRAITMGVGTILDSKRCILAATGEEKASIIAKAVEGPVTSMISATALQLHPRCTVIVDEDAASHLEQIEYYRWIFENEPEWEPYR